MVRLTLPSLAFLPLVAIAGAAQLPRADREWSVETAPPVVVKTSPEAGATDVDPRLGQIRVTFSKPMLVSSWSWVKVSDATYPESQDKPRFESDRRTCTLPVNLHPGKTYVIWINDARSQGFVDQNRTPAVPYLLVFQTRARSATKVRR